MKREDLKVGMKIKKNIDGDIEHDVEEILCIGKGTSYAVDQDRYEGTIDDCSLYMYEPVKEVVKIYQHFFIKEYNTTHVDTTHSKCDWGSWADLSYGPCKHIATKVIEL